LPSSYTRGDQHVRKLYQDSMEIVRCFGKPSLFITMTANPQWPGIVGNLAPGCTAQDDPALKATVIALKRRALDEQAQNPFWGSC
ncbi:hypothetical protein K470DRAFT_209067, partial [Piedraia hortae CBS 480.64]